MKKIPIPLLYILTGFIVLIGFIIILGLIGLIPMFFEWLATFNSFNNFVDNYLGKILIGIVISGGIVFIIVFIIQGIKELSLLNSKYNFFLK